jgi:HK97 gp10 family phage protein
MKVKVTLEGMAPLQRMLKEAPEVVRELASDPVLKTSFAVGQRAKAFCPVATGALKASITATARGLNGRVGVAAGGAAGRVGPEVYWRFVEFGTSRVPARPFFRPAAEAETDAYVARMRAIGARLERDLKT